MSVVVQLLGYPGTGKYTVAKELVRAMEADGRTTRLLDNHASGNLILSLVPKPTHGIPAPVMDRIIEVRDGQAFSSPGGYDDWLEARGRVRA